MAVSFSNCSLLAHHDRRPSALLSSATAEPSKTLKQSTLCLSAPCPLICKPVLWFSNSSSLLRPSFKPRLAARDSVSTVRFFLPLF